MNEREEKRRKKTFRKKRKTGGGRINWVNKRKAKTNKNVTHRGNLALLVITIYFLNLPLYALFQRPF